jgi:hypothetical protein
MVVLQKIATDFAGSQGASEKVHACVYVCVDGCWYPSYDTLPRAGCKQWQRVDLTLWLNSGHVLYCCTASLTPLGRLFPQKPPSHLSSEYKSKAQNLFVAVSLLFSCGSVVPTHQLFIL